MINADDLQKSLELDVICRGKGKRLSIEDSDINRPGLQLAGFWDYFPCERPQVLGKVEMTYLEQLDALSFRGQECDGQGRVLLPGKIRQNILGDEKDVEITGANDHVRIVARPAADEQFAAFMADLPDILDSISALEGQA